MRIYKKVLIGIAICFIAIQLIKPARNNKSESASSNDIAAVYSTPKNVKQILEIACYDCHSDHTYYPWYANIQPFGWLFNRHIKAGKAKINFSNFGSLPIRLQAGKLKNVQHSIEDGTMPLYSYTLIHRKAILEQKENTVLIIF